MKFMKKFLAGLLAIVMMLTLIPATTTFAADDTASTGTPNIQLDTWQYNDTVMEGDTIKYTITAGDFGFTVSSFNAGMSYDPDMLEITDFKVLNTELTKFDPWGSFFSLDSDSSESSDSDTLPLTITNDVDNHRINITSSTTEEEKTYSAAELAIVTFKVKQAGNIKFTLYENSTGTSGCVNDNIAVTTTPNQAKAIEEKLTYEVADGTKQEITAHQIISCDKTPNGNYLLKDVLAAAGISTKADCMYQMVGAKNYTVNYDADYYDDIAVYYDGGWKANYENIPDFVPEGEKWYKVGGLSTIKEVNHKFGEDFTCENKFTTGMTKDEDGNKVPQETVCGWECEEHDWGPEVLVPATTTTAGSATTICKVCGYTVLEEIAAIDNISLSTNTYTYNGSAKKPAVTIKDTDGNVIDAANYSVVYSNNTNVGTAKVKVTFKDRYSGTLEKTFAIKAKTLPSAVSLKTKSYTYNGKVNTPDVVVKDGSKTLKKGVDYTVSYVSGRKNVGTYKVTVKGKGNYAGSRSVSFTIQPKGTSISKVAVKSKAFAAKWKKQSAQTTGYQIRYATNSKLSKAKTVTVKKNSTTSVTVKKLSAKKKYYVQVRTYKKVGSKTYYSGWSKTKSVTTKK